MLIQNAQQTSSLSHRDYSTFMNLAFAHDRLEIEIKIFHACATSKIAKSQININMCVLMFQLASLDVSYVYTDVTCDCLAR